MKTILFFYQEVLLNRSVCKAYVTFVDNVADFIECQRRCYQREIKEGFIKDLRVKIIDKIDLIMH